MNEKNTVAADSRVIIVVMGVSGSGKTTLGKALAEALSLPFIDADDIHSQANKDKMSRGEPLTDADRGPWLVSIRKAAVEALEGNACGARLGVVVACSALKTGYREVLRGKWAHLGYLETHQATAVSHEKSDAQLPVEEKGEEVRGNGVSPAPAQKPRTVFVHPSGSRSALWKRMTSREGHFMKANMLESQLDTLENPTEMGEEGIVEVQLEVRREEQVQAALKGLRTIRAI